MTSRRCTMIAALVAAVAVPPTVAAQSHASSELFPIAAALRDGNRDFVPDRLGERVTVAGVMTTLPRRARGRIHYALIQNPGSGVRLVADSTTGLFADFGPGDLVEATGTLEQYKGTEEVLVTSITRVGRSALPEPRHVLVADLLTERYSGRLVSVSGELVRMVTDSGAPRYELRDRSGGIPVHLTGRFWRDAELTRRMASGGGRAEVVGIAAQSDSLPPYDSGYRLAPRVPEDLVFEPTPPYRAMALLAVVGLVAVLLLYTSHRRRRAERRAAELQQLSEELRRSEAALRDSEERHRLLFERNPLPMWVFDSGTDEIVAVNDAATAHYGYGRDEFLRMRICDLRAPEEMPQLLARRAPPGSGRNHAGAHRHRKKDGATIVVEVDSDDVVIDGRPARIVLANDITHRSALEEQLRQTQKMDAVGQLAGGVAHDFNNLVTVIQAHAQFLEEEISAADPLREDVAAIRQASSRAAGLTRQLLAFSRKQLLQPRLLDLSTVARDAEAMLRRLIGEDITVVTRLESDLEAVLADVGQLEQVLVNLALNARDAMPGGGSLNIETCAVDFDGAYTDLHAPVAPGRYIMLAVTDSGCGMDEATRKRVFEPFFTTKEPGKGTGLGLATVYGIVKQSGGYIWCYSEPGRGTTFKVYLPVAAASAEASAPSEAAALPGTETILVVEDEAPLRSIARRVLTRQGYRVLDAQDGHAALRLIAEYQGRIDLVVTDMVMPGLNGRALAERLAASGCDAPVLYMSGYTDDDIVRRGLLQPGLAFLQKPFSPNSLAQAVRSTLEGVPVTA